MEERGDPGAARTMASNSGFLPKSRKARTGGPGYQDRLGCLGEAHMESPRCQRHLTLAHGVPYSFGRVLRSLALGWVPASFFLEHSPCFSVSFVSILIPFCGLMQASFCSHLFSLTTFFLLLNHPGPSVPIPLPATSLGYLTRKLL